jgi:hypothetical protein
MGISEDKSTYQSKENIDQNQIPSSVSFSFYGGKRYVFSCSIKKYITKILSLLSFSIQTNKKIFRPKEDKLGGELNILHNKELFINSLPVIVRVLFNQG